MFDKPLYKQGDIVKCVYGHNGMVAGAKYEITADSGGSFVAVKGVPGVHPSDCVKLHKKRIDAIIITTDGENSTARLMRGKQIVSETKLKLAKDDKHNMKTLAAYAVQKLIPNDGNMIINVKAGYNGSVAVINSKNSNYTDGKIIEFFDGSCVTIPFFIGKVNTFEDLKNKLKGSNLNFDVIELHRR